MRYSPFFHVKMRKFAKMDFQEGLVAVLFTVKKEDHSFEWSSYTPLCGLKKQPNFR